MDKEQNSYQRPEETASGRNGMRAVLGRNVVKSTLLLGGTLFLVFVASELVLRRVYHPENLASVVCFDAELGWTLRPNARLRSVDELRGLDYWIRTNSLGMRDREISVQKRPGTRRIMITGDSITFGTGVDAERRFSDFLDRALGEDIEVVNSGVCGWGNDQELLHYEAIGTRLEPDIVIVTVTMANDVINNMLDHLFLGSAPKPKFVVEQDSLVLVEQTLEQPRPQLSHRVKNTLRKSRVLLFVKRGLDALSYERRMTHTCEKPPIGFGKSGVEKVYSHWSVYESSYRGRLDEAWRVTEAIVARFSKRCEENGARLIVFAFPLKLEVDDAWRNGLLTHFDIDSTWFDFGKPYKRLASFCEDHRIEFIYPLETFRQTSRSRRLYFEKDSHPNVYGHVTAARVLLDYLNERHGLVFEIAESDRAFFEFPVVSDGGDHGVNP